MVITIAIELCVLLIIVWGISFAGFSGQYHQDFMSTESTKMLKGFAAILIILHHISQERPFMESNTIQAFMRLGPALVAVFFFCSGYGLIKRYDNNPDYLKGFIKRRVVIGLMVPFYVNTILYALFYLVNGTQFEALQFLSKLTGLTLMNEFAWFPIVLFLLYFAFYFIFKYINNQKQAFALMLLVILAQGIFFCHWGHFAWWAGSKNWWMSPGSFLKAPWWKQERVFWFFGQWWVNSSIGMFVGMIFARKEEQILSFMKKRYWLKLVTAIILLVIFNYLTAQIQGIFGYYSEYYSGGPGISDKLISYASQLPQITAFLLVLYLIRMKLKVSNPVLAFFGKYSLHTYLMNLMAIRAFSFLIYKNEKPQYWEGTLNLAIYAVAVMVASILLGVAEAKICDFIIKKIENNH